MSNYLTEVDEYKEGVYQLEITDPVLGGPDGTSNKPLKDLASRTKYLKARVDEILQALLKNSIYTKEEDFKYLGQTIDYGAEFDGVTESWKPVYKDTDGLYKLAVGDGTLKQNGVGFSYLGEDYQAVIFSGLVQTELEDLGVGDDLYLSETVPGYYSTTQTPVKLGVVVGSNGLVLLNTGAGSGEVMLDKLMESLRSYPDALASSTKAGLIRSFDQNKLNALGTGAFADVGIGPSQLVTWDMLQTELEINPNHIFATDTERDDYFVANPEELEDELVVRVDQTIYKYDIDDTVWLEVIQGPIGPAGPKGEDGESGFLAMYEGDWVAESAPYAQYAAVKHNDIYWVNKVEGNSEEPGTDNTWDVWNPEGNPHHRDYHSYQNWDMAIHYNEEGSVSDVRTELGLVSIDEIFTEWNDKLLANTVLRSFDGGANFTILGSQVIKYNADDLIGTFWWPDRGNESDRKLIQVTSIVGMDVQAINTWMSIVNSFDNFEDVIDNTDAFPILQTAEEANAAIIDASNSMAILDSKNPVTVPTASDDLEGSITASSETSGNEAWRVFDGSLGTQWLTPTGNTANEFVGYEFGSTKWLYKIVISPTDNDSSPQDCKLQYYDEDSGTWVNAAEFTLSSGYNINQEFRVASPVRASKWRLYIDNNYGNTDTIGIARLQFYGF